MIYYHVTDSYLENKILNEGLIGNPVIYLTDTAEKALCIRFCQIRRNEKIGHAVIFQVTYNGDLFIDPNTTPLESAWMVYDDIQPSQLKVYYPTHTEQAYYNDALSRFAKSEGARTG